VAGMRIGQPALGVERRHAHGLHEGRDVVSSCHESQVPEFIHKPAGPVEGQLEVDLIHGGHDEKIGLAHRNRLVVEARSGEVEKTGLMRKRQGVGLVDHRLALVPFTRPSAPDKKSFSMVSSPILA